MKKNKSQRHTHHDINPRQATVQATLAVLSQDQAPGGPCPEPEELAAFSEGKLSGSRQKAMVNHLNHCDTCRRQVFLIQSTIDEMTTEQVPFWSLIYDKARQLLSVKMASGGLGFALATCLLLVFLVPRQNDLHQLMSDSYKSLPPDQISQYIAFDSRGETDRADPKDAPYLHAYLAGRATGKASLSSPNEALPPGYFKDDLKNLYFNLGQWSILLECACISGDETSDAFWKKQGIITDNVNTFFKKQTASNTLFKDTTDILSFISQSIQSIQASGSTTNGCSDILATLAALQDSLKTSSL